MSNFIIYLPLEKYLSEWLVNRLGSPVVFPQYSNENAVIRTFISKLPEGMAPEIPNQSLTAIAIPDSASKPPETYNYLGERGKNALREAIKDLFIRSLWADLSPLEKGSVGLNKLIYAWCEMHGIGIDRAETVRQCYYRIRKAYAKKGINLRKSSR